MKSWKKFKKKKKQESSLFNIRYIVVHSTGTRTALHELDKLPYHYLITKTGKLINLRPLQAHEGTIEVALTGGIDKSGIHTDTRTPQQNDTLFNTLVLLNESFPEAKIVGANEVYVYGFKNPGFEVREWLCDYLPSFLPAA
ncbi:hypothetical protein CAP35_07640 [Chitinophagaceae bacterium IBVUCB1]|nr:hypothetical protein CAP35_07640 [Chitinophagaceae bacterium IBVUCB1]